MYLFFIGYADPGVPSFSKFARACGITTADIENFRKHSRFELAYRECREIRRDYLIDHALDRRFDSSFTKFIVAEEFAQDGKDDISNFSFTLEVKE